MKLENVLFTFYMNCNAKRISANTFPRAAHYMSKSRMWLASRGLVTPVTWRPKYVSLLSATQNRYKSIVDSSETQHCKDTCVSMAALLILITRWRRRMYVNNTNGTHCAAEVILQQEHYSWSNTAVFAHSTSYTNAPQRYVTLTLPVLSVHTVGSPDSNDNWRGCRRKRPFSSLRSTLFWDITLRRVVIVYRRFWTTHRSHLHGSRVQDPWRWDRYVVPKRR
jgi:hypothetical protein